MIGRQPICKTTNGGLDANWIVKHGIRYTSMPGWSGQLPDDDLWRVATFLPRVKTLPAAVDSAWKAPPPPPAPYRGAGT